MTAMCMLIPVTTWAYGNDYLEKQRHYSVRANGQDVIHFCIPVYSYGSSNNYYVHKMSYIYLDNISGETGSRKVANVYSKRNGIDTENANYESGKGTAYLNMESGMGRAVVTNTYDSINVFVGDGQESGKLLVKKGEDDGFYCVTKLDVRLVSAYFAHRQTKCRGGHLR